MAAQKEELKIDVDVNDLSERGFDEYLNRTEYSQVDINAATASRYGSITNISTGELPSESVIDIGSKNIRIDGGNRRITVNDGVNQRVLIGYQKDGF